MSNFVGVNWEFNAGGCLLTQNNVISAVCEERYSRIKNDISFPKNALAYLKKIIKQNQINIDGIGVSSLQAYYNGILYKATSMSVADHIKEQHEYWYPILYQGNNDVDDIMIHKERWDLSQYPQEYWSKYDSEKRKTFTEDSQKIIADYMELDPTKVVRIEHHNCHTYYGYYCSPFRNDKALIVTIDGSGDNGINATISIAENGRILRIFETDKCVLGRIYRHITLMLGMKPLEHEYKVMGLSPYAKKNHALPVYEILNNILYVDGLNFEWKNKPPDSYFYFKKVLEGYRFDNIAAGLQMWVEDMLCKWVTNVVKETNIDTIVFSGGVSMNVKAMGKVASLPCVKKMFVPGSGADETNCIGAAIGAAIQFNGGKLEKPVQVDSLYLGPEPEDEDAVIQNVNLDQYDIVKNVTNEYIAGLLKQGVVIGRCVGSMEFGQRALGNRSILADPTIPGIVEKINNMIKSRDFWMPFAPVVLDTYMSKYLINPKGIDSPHMAIAFETTTSGWEAMKGACHAADRSARAQILKRSDNPEFYDLLKSFEKLTGRGSLLNTSFNLHGFPIVNSALDAYDVFTQSELEGLLLKKHLVLKRKISINTQ